MADRADRRSRVRGAWSLAVETLQYVLALGRVSSVDDVLLNALGAGLAASLARVLPGVLARVLPTGRAGGLRDVLTIIRPR